ncbi:pleiotropic drug resistance protein 2 isoform X1 [Capsicum annuum]|uniref:pleiotropic drug resistance protein 2 isoform X1 n=1 Tax=Capsicum annuum TaxID=4072 RepID=UPI0007BF87F0|nr:pleiotropic drug resistance protein 2 isoform X1 [Capsicum annuum]
MHMLDLGHYLHSGMQLSTLYLSSMLFNFATRSEDVTTSWASRRWKTTLLKALAAVPDKDLRVAGKISYCGHELSEFIPQRTCAYISQHDLHHGEMTVRETLDFAGRSVGVRTRYELLAELSRREKELGIKPDPEIDVLMKATAVAGQESSLVTGYVLKIFGLDTCADIMIGDQMRRVRIKWRPS